MSACICESECDLCVWWGPDSQDRDSPPNNPGPLSEEGADGPGKHSPAFFWGSRAESPQVRAARPPPPQKAWTGWGPVSQTVPIALYVGARAYFCLVWLILAGCSRPIMPCFSTRLFRRRNVLFVSQAENPKPPLWLAVLRLQAATHLFRFLLVYICRRMTC